MTQIKLQYNHNSGGYDNDFGCYVNCLTEVDNTSGRLYKIVNKKAYLAKYGEIADDNSIKFIEGIATCELA